MLYSVKKIELYPNTKKDKYDVLYGEMLILRWESQVYFDLELVQIQKNGCPSFLLLSQLQMLLLVLFRMLKVLGALLSSS